ncbi:MAG: hypothetical protein ACREBR_01380, partial [bacterium]
TTTNKGNISDRFRRLFNRDSPPQTPRISVVNNDTVDTGGNIQPTNVTMETINSIRHNNSSISPMSETSRAHHDIMGLNNDQVSIPALSNDHFRLVSPSRDFRTIVEQVEKTRRARIISMPRHRTPK